MYVETHEGTITFLSEVAIHAERKCRTKGILFARDVFEDTGRHKVMNKGNILGIYNDLHAARQEYKNIKQAIARGDELYVMGD